MWLTNQFIQIDYYIHDDWSIMIIDLSIISVKENFNT